MKEFDLATLTHQEAYQLLNGAVVPRPIALVSSCSRDGAHNLAPFSFFNVVASSPPALSFSVMRRGQTDHKKDTLLNIEETGEFVVQIVTGAIAEAVNRTSADYPRGEDELDAVGLTPLPSRSVRPRRVAESPVQFECRLLQIVEIGTGPGGGSLVIGEVVRAHVSEAVWADGRIDQSRLDAVARMGGATWLRTTDRFELTRPTRVTASGQVS